MQHHLVEQPGVSNGLAAAVAAAAARGGDPMRLVHLHVDEEELEEDPDSSDLEVAWVNSIDWINNCFNFLYISWRDGLFLTQNDAYIFLRCVLILL